MKKVLIVGGTGFLGSNLYSFLKKKKFEVDIVSRKKKVKKYLGIKNFFCIDIADKKKIKKKLKNKKYDFVFNFGGNIDHKNKKQVFKSHYIGLKNLLDIFSKKKIELFVQIGSSMEYGKKKSPQKEGMACLPVSYYGRAKLNATKLCIKKYKKENFPVIVLRLFQVYGPKQKTNRLIPYVIYKCLNKKNFNITAGKQFRDFLYIDDLIRLLYRIMVSKKKKIKGKIFNVGFGRPVQVKKVIKKICQIVKSGKPFYGKVKLRKEEQNILYPDIKKISTIFKWKPKIGIDEGLKKTIKSYMVD